MLFKSLKAHASRHVLLTLAVCTFIPATAMATAPVFTPAAGWEVNAGQLANVRGLKPMKLPCVISTEYDNGYVVRFSGGGNKLLALAIDFRQDVFAQGRQYSAMVTIGGGYVKQVKATAFSKSTLIFNLRPLPDFYNAAQKGSEMEIEIEGNALRFSLARMGDMFGELENCYAGGAATPIKPITTQTASKAPVAKVERETVKIAQAPNEAPAKQLPNSFNDIVRNAEKENAEPTQQIKLSAAQPRPPKLSGERTPAPVMPMPDENAPQPITPRANSVSRPVDMAATPPRTSAPSSTWEAEAGEDIKMVLSRWSERAGYDLQWQSDQNGKVAQNVTVSGSFEDAVAQLLAENSAATGIGAHVEMAGGATKPIAQSAGRSAPMPMTAAAPMVRAGQWTAAPGSNIQSVLDQWSSKAGVAIVWQSYMDFAVKQPINASGSYEEAVQSLLDQYSNDSVRPTGQLNTDPNTGARTLLMDKSS